MEAILIAAIVIVAGGGTFIFFARHLNDRKRTASNANRIICPHCKESIRNISKVCKYCEKDLSPAG